MRRLGPTKLDEQMIKWLRETRLPHAFILTKADKLKRSKKLRAMKNFEVSLNKTADHPLIPYSAVTGEGKNELWSLINQSIAQTQ